MTFFKKITKNCFKKISVILNPSIVILNTFALLSVNSVKNLRINSVKNLKFLLKIRVLRFFAVLRMTPKKGFTLIELLLVIAIISFIASIIISAVSSTREKARDAKRIADLNQIEKAIELYRSDNNGNPPGTDGDEYVNGVPNWIPGLIPTHIRIVPSDPIDIDPFQYHYKRQGSDFELAARLERRDNQAARNDGGPGGQKFYEIGSKNNIISTTGSGPTGGGWGGTGLTVSVTSIFPSSGNNSGSASISTIEGTEFAAFGTITVKLIKLGYTDIVGTGFTRVSSTTISGGSFNLTGVAAGQWDVVVIDNGLTGTPSGSLDNGFTVISGPDTLSPTINITSPANAATVQATININADTTDNVGVVKVEFKRDATLTSEVRIFDDTVPAWSAIWDTTTATNGSHTLVAVASDAAGNRATSSVITVTVNNIAPTVTTNPESDLAPTSVTLNGSANPNNLLTTGWFRRWTALQASCIDSGGTRVPTTGGTSLGALNTPQPYSQSVTGLTASTNYWYCAFASNSVGIEAGTVRPFTTPAAGDTIPPSTPTGLTATAISSSQINLAWTASTDNVAVTGYKVYRCTGSACTPSVLFTTLGVVTTYSNTGLTASTIYGYKVSAIDAAGNESVLSATAYATTPAGPVGWWKFDGDALDSSGNGNNGTLVGSPVFTTGTVGTGALIFDMINDKVTVTPAGSINGMTTMSVSAWIYQETAGGGGFGRIMRKGTITAPTGTNCRWELSVSATNFTFRSCFTTTAGIWTLPIPGMNAWHHIVVTYTDGNTVNDPSIYFDGALQTATESSSPSGTKVADTSNLTIGDWGDGTRLFDGNMDDVRVYNRVLTSAEISALYALGDTIPPSTPTGLTATAISSSQINLAWTASTDNVAVTGYKVYRCTGSACTPSVLFTTLGVVTTYSNTGLTASTIYGYKVSAIDAAGNESVLSATAYATTPAGPVGWWKFDGDALDSSGNGNNGTVNGAIFTTGTVGTGALSFDGIDDNVLVADNNSLDFGTGDMSISVWIKPNSVATLKQAIVDKSDGTVAAYRFNTSDADGDRLKFTRGSLFADGVQSNDGALVAGVWQHIVAVANTSGTDIVTFYINGAAQGSGNLLNSSFTNANPLMIGQKGYSGSGVVNFNGLIDDVRVYNRVLSAGEVNAIFIEP